MRPVRALVLHASSAENETLSYQQGWPRALREHPRFDCDLVNALDGRDRLRLRLRRRPPAAVIILHSIFSNHCHLEGPLRERVRRIRAPKVFFVGNEYKLMPEKIGFCEELEVALLVSQLYAQEAHRLYEERLGCAVVGIPNTGFDPALFAPRVPLEERPVELGYRAYQNPPYLGHNERADLVEAFTEAAGRHGLAVDLSLDPRERFTEPAWADFLNRCKGQLGSEAGGDYFELTDDTRRRVNEYVTAEPGWTFTDVRERFFQGYESPVSGRALSGRIVEAAATKTVQLLIEGEYGGFFQPDIHYIPVRKDFANVDEAVEKLRDQALTRTLTESAYRVALEELTYSRLVDRLHEALAPLL